MLNRINLITDSRIKREKESTFGGIAKFDSQINSWGDLIRESGATPNRYTYSMQLSAFWKKLGGLDQSHLSLDQSYNALNELFQVEYSTRQLRQDRKIWLIRIKARLPNTQGLLMKFATMGTMSAGLNREEHGGLPWFIPLGLRTWARRPITEVV
jgi:hypothetical protein